VYTGATLPVDKICKAAGALLDACAAADTVRSLQQPATQQQRFEEVHAIMLIDRKTGGGAAGLSSV
jgi:hypothetical protein